MSGGVEGIPGRDVIGLIGVGLIGTALCERMLAGGKGVLGYDVEAGRMDELEQAGGCPAAGVEGVVAECERVVLSLPDSEVARRVVGQMRSGLRRGQLVVDTTTGAPETAETLHRELGELGVDYVDATISGSSAQARRGEVVVMAGGGAEPYARCEDLFRLWARRSFHVGGAGAGARMKLVTNLVLGLNRAALAEGLFLAGELGLGAARALQVLMESPAYSKIMETKGEKMVRGDYAVEARLAQHLKDVRLMMRAGEHCGVTLPLTAAHRRLLELAEEAGLGVQDNSAVFEVFERHFKRRGT